MPSFDLELMLQHQGFTLVAGVDEAGRGPLAGPVVAAAAVLPPAVIAAPSSPDWIGLIDDSKALTPLQRRRALEYIEIQATVGVGMASSQEIDARGIVPATRLAMKRAIGNLPLRPSHLLVDFVRLPRLRIPYRAVVHGDAISYSIAAASIVAKETRDRLMEEADSLYEGYGFSQHKGYGTPQHLRTLKALGPCPIHRRSFSPVRALLGSSDPRE